MNRKYQAAVEPAVGNAGTSDRATTLRTLSSRPVCDLTQLTVQEQCQRMAEWLAGWRSFLAVNEALLMELEVTQREFAALLEVDRSVEPHGPTIGMLAARLQIRHNTSVGLVTGMCRKGYMRRVRGARDRRQAHVQLTDSGRRVMTALVRAHCREFHEIRMELLPSAAG